MRKLQGADPINKMLVRKQDTTVYMKLDKMLKKEQNKGLTEH